MDRKSHWAYPALTRPGLTRAQLLVHFRHEYLVYVRDFPVLVARALGQTPPLPDVRRALAENIYEEQTGGISRSAPHPELFLQMMAGLGYSAADFQGEGEDLHPAAARYRRYLCEKSGDGAGPWAAAVALLTIFVEGSVHERAELAGEHHRPKGDEAVLRHPLVLHYGCPPAAMALTRAHGDVEGGHRQDAWAMILDHVPDSGPDAEAVVATVEGALGAWLAYRDGVAERMGLTR